MYLAYRNLIISLLFISTGINDSLEAQDNKTENHFFSFLSNSKFEGVEGAYIINLNSKEFAISDSSGYFKIIAEDGDFLLIKNIIYRDTIVKILESSAGRNIILKERYNQINELKVFHWGNSYEDFKEAFIALPTEESISDQLGFSKPDPDYIPFYMDDKALKNPLYLLVSPISYLYFNLSRKEKVNRKAYHLIRNKSKQDYFDALISKEKIMDLIQCSNEEYENFSPFLNQNLICDYNCTELEILSEIFSWWLNFNEKEKNIK